MKFNYDYYILAKKYIEWRRKYSSSFEIYADISREQWFAFWGFITKQCEHNNFEFSEKCRIYINDFSKFINFIKRKL